MKIDDLEAFVGNDRWYYIKLKSQYFYKCKFVGITESAITIRDKFDKIIKINLEEVIFVSEWEDRTEDGYQSTERVV